MNKETLELNKQVGTEMMKLVWDKAIGFTFFFMFANFLLAYYGEVKDIQKCWVTW